MSVCATNYPTLILTRVAATSASTSSAANLIIVGTTDSSALILLSLNPSCYDHYGYACNGRLMFTTPVITCHDHNEYSDNTHALTLSSRQLVLLTVLLSLTMRPGQNTTYIV